MIFGKEYDASLCYILKSNVMNRNEIIKFIEEIPDELIENIKKSIEDARHHYSYNERDKSIPTNVYCGDNVFHFLLRPDFGLEIIKAYEKEDKLQVLFELTLIPVDLEYLKKFELFEDEWIGNVTNNFRMYNTEFDDKEYNIIRTPFGYGVFYNVILFNKLPFPIYRPIDIEFSEDITKDDISKMRLRLFK